MDRTGRASIRDSRALRTVTALTLVNAVAAVVRSAA
jgi:hypothetical protein